MGDLPRQGIKATSPPLADRFLTTEPPGKSQFAYSASEASLASHPYGLFSGVLIFTLPEWAPWPLLSHPAPT